MDTEPGRVFGSEQHHAGYSSQADKFETLCIIRVDLSTIPHHTNLGKERKTCYIPDFDVILLVGLTELKAQISWIDPATVSSQGFLSYPAPFLIFVVWDPGDGEAVRNTVIRAPHPQH